MPSNKTLFITTYLFIFPGCFIVSYDETVIITNFKTTHIYGHCIALTMHYDSQREAPKVINSIQPQVKIIV